MAWSPPARQCRSWLVEQARDYATQISHHTRDGTPLEPCYSVQCVNSVRHHSSGGTAAWTVSTVSSVSRPHRPSSQMGSNEAAECAAIQAEPELPEEGTAKRVPYYGRIRREARVECRGGSRSSAGS